MDDDKQVKDLTTQSTIGRFLNKPIMPDERDKEHFDLETEFAKTAKNRSLLIPLVVAAFLLVLAIGAWVASQFTEQASQKSSVSIGSFEDLKLKEIFDTARRNKKDLEEIQAQIEQLTQASDAKVAALTRAGGSKADIASVNDNSGDEVKGIQAQTAREVAAEKAALAKALAPLKAKADEVQKKIDSYDDRIGQMNKKNQQVLDTQQRLFDLEKKKLIDQYEARIQRQIDEANTTLARVKQERDDLIATMKAKHADDIRKLILKYNPIISDAFVKAQLAKDGANPAEYLATAFPDRIGQQSLVPADLQNELAARVDRTRRLLAALRAIPYENSVPPLLNALDKAISDSLVGYNGFLPPLAAHMTMLDGVIAARDATIVARDATIAERDATIASLQSTIASLEAALAAEKAGRQADLQAAADTLAAEKADRKAAEIAEAADRAQEKARAEAYLARWTGAVTDLVEANKNEDGVVADAKVTDDLIVVLKADRDRALREAIIAAANPPPPTPGKPVVPAGPVNLATIRDGFSEVAILSLEPQATGWRAKIVKLGDPKRPVRAFDRLVLQLPVKR